MWSEETNENAKHTRMLLQEGAEDGPLEEDIPEHFADEEAGRVPKGTPSWHPARAHRSSGQDSMDTAGKDGGHEVDEDTVINSQERGSLEWRRVAGLGPDGLPTSWSQAKRDEVEAATAAQLLARRQRREKGLLPLPHFPTHSTRCGERACRPGEGNMKGYTMSFQPYEHREAYVQSRSRDIPHPAGYSHYSGLVALAQSMQKDGMVIVTSGDWDYRELVLNWVMHTHKHNYSNALVIAMDTELFEELQRRGIASFDNSANLDAWQTTCLQRHIQAVRTERHLAVAALIAAGIDVLHTDSTVIFLQDTVAWLLAQPAEIDVFFQRDDWPEEPVHKMGTAVNAGFIYLRSSRSLDVARLVNDAVKRGMIEFYLRWNNIPDQYGWSFVLSNGKENAPCFSPGIRPFRGHRQRLDRYDQTDFDDM
eukprot:gene13777-16284_t